MPVTMIENVRQFLLCRSSFEVSQLCVSLPCPAMPCLVPCHALPCMLHEYFMADFVLLLLNLHMDQYNPEGYSCDFAPREVFLGTNSLLRVILQ